MNKIRTTIWAAVNNHFSVTNAVRLEARLKYEKNKTIAQTIAIGFCNQYGLDRESTESLLCIESSGYDTKLSVFLDLVKLSASDKQHGFKDPDLKDFYLRYMMCNRFIRRRLKSYVEII